MVYRHVPRRSVSDCVNEPQSSVGHLQEGRLPPSVTPPNRRGLPSRSLCPKASPERLLWNKNCHRATRAHRSREPMSVKHTARL